MNVDVPGRIVPHSTERPLRILHVVGQMQRGGVETWLMRILRGIDRERFQVDFLVETAEPGAYDAEVHALGGKIIPCLGAPRPWDYARNFKQILRRYGPYDVVHSHEHFFSGYIMRLADQAGVPVRIAHAHTDSSMQDAGATIRRRAYVTLMKSWIARHATIGIAVSRDAARNLFGAKWQSRDQYRVLPCGIDLEPFTAEAGGCAPRAELGIPSDAFVVGHVGRFIELKNHVFLIAVFGAVVQQLPNARLLLIGEGPLRPSIEAHVARIGLGERVIFAGGRDDVPSLMRGAMDIFVLPSRYEGLPVVALEAQAAGLPVVLSDTITREVAAIAEHVHFVSLEQSPKTWADRLLAIREAPAIVPGDRILAAMAQGPFDVQHSRAVLERIYAMHRA